MYMSREPRVASADHYRLLVKGTSCPCKPVLREEAPLCRCLSGTLHDVD